MAGVSPRKLEDDRRLAERAAEWLGILQAPTEAERTEFADWLAASPRHAEEFLLVSALHEQLSRLPVEEMPQVRAALERNAATVVALPGAPAHKHNAAVRGRRFAMAAALVCVAAGTAAALWWMGDRGTAYTTGTGEQRTLRLDDGSTLRLNTQSRVRVRFSNEERQVSLLRGEALFTIQRDPERPFKVLTDTALVQVLGTQFNVHRNAQGTRISVVEGRVRVMPVDAGASASRQAASSPALSAGEEASVSTRGTVSHRSAPEAVAQAIAWRDQRLVFVSDTLADVAAQFNRYNRSPRIRVEGGAGLRRYSGVFNTDDPQSLIAFLREDTELELEERDGDLRIRAAGDRRN